jgi:biopolymer transport protein ExbD
VELKGDPASPSGTLAFSLVSKRLRRGAWPPGGKVAITRLGVNRRIADINVTPMADVIIVLLIIFMITLQAISEGPVRALPEATHTHKEDRGPVVVSVTGDLAMFVGASRVVTMQDLSERLHAELALSSTRLVQVRADAGLRYAQIAKVLEVCRSAGAEEVALIARPRPGA